MHLFLFTNTAQRELVSICTQRIRNSNSLSLSYYLDTRLWNAMRATDSATEQRYCCLISKLYDFLVSILYHPMILPKVLQTVHLYFTTMKWFTWYSVLFYIIYCIVCMCTVNYKLYICTSLQWDDLLGTVVFCFTLYIV